MAFFGFDLSIPDLSPGSSTWYLQMGFLLDSRILILHVCTHVLCTIYYLLFTVTGMYLISGQRRRCSDWIGDLFMLSFAVHISVV